MEFDLPISEFQLAMADLGVQNSTETCRVLQVPVGVLTMDAAIQRVNRWVMKGSRAHLVTFVNAHMAVEAQLRPMFRSHLREMDLNCPDGAPIFWLVRREHGRRADKISGPEFMPLFCEQSVELGHRHFLYGGTEGVAEEVCQELKKRYPAQTAFGSAQ